MEEETAVAPTPPCTSPRDKDDGSVSSTTTTSLASSLENVVLSRDPHDDITQQSLDQATFFRSVEDGNERLLHILLKNRKVDINAYNDQGMTALHLAVYKYEIRRKLDIAEILLKHGANACLKAAAPPQAKKLSIVRHDSTSLHSDSLLETKKISLDKKIPLLVALELKSALYLRGWEYRHWDSMLHLLAEETCKHYEKNIHEPVVDLKKIEDVVKQGWNSVFQSGRHDLVQVCIEGKDITALKLLLSGASKTLKTNLESLALCHQDTLEIKDASFNNFKAILQFLYTGTVEPNFMEQKGIDLFLTAHKYGVESLKSLCESQINPTQDNWIKLLTAAVDCDSEVLIFKCAKSIKEVMEKRHESTHMSRKSFSDSSHATPHQLFHISHKS